jgi:hypothetical protein
MAVWTPWTVVFRSWLMSVIITFMFEPAKLQMNCASASGTSIRLSAGATPVPAALATGDPTCPGGRGVGRATRAGSTATHQVVGSGTQDD